MEGFMCNYCTTLGSGQGGPAWHDMVLQAPKIQHSSVYLLSLLDQPLGAPDRLERPDRVHQIEDLRAKYFGARP